MKTIRILILFFGKIPDTFPLFLKCIQQNPSVDFLLFTDDEKAISRFRGQASNLVIEHSTLSAINDILQAKIDPAIRFENPYKLCDARVLYGDLFSDFFEGYDFWGFCDLDMLFGDIRSFLTEEILTDNSRISLFGHLQLIKNTKGMRSLYKRFDYRSVLLNPASFAIDEGPLTDLCVREGIAQYSLHEVICDADFRVYSFKNAAISAADVGFYYARWENGKLFCVTADGEKEILYIHFQKRKMPVLCDSKSNLFYISYLGFTDSLPKGFSFQKRNLFFYLQAKWKDAKRRLTNRRLMRGGPKC